MKGHFKEKAIHGLKVIIRDGLVVINYFLTLLPIRKHTYLFESFNGKDISDNPLAIYNQLIKDKPQLKKRAVFGVQPHMYKTLHQKYPHIKMVRRFLPQWIYISARAQFWIFNSRMPTWWKKNKHTTYLQTWHGTPLKKLGVDMSQVKMPGTTTEHYKKHFVKETKRWDYLIAPNQYSKNIFKHAFQFHHQFLDTGYPRNDILYRDNKPDIVKKLKQHFFGDPNVDVVTYAPTWRDDDYIHQGAYKFEMKFSLKDFFKHVGSDTVLIIRPHYLIKSPIYIPKPYQKRVKVMKNEDISTIYLMTDLLITDYSSVMFDFANLNRPMLFFAYDLKHYQGTLRGFYFNYQKDIPGPLVTNAGQLYSALDIYRECHRFPGFRPKMKHFRQFYCTWESAHSSEQIAQILER